MARRKGLENFNLVLIRYLMRQQKKDTTALAAEIEYSVSNLSKVLNRQSPLSEPMGKALAEALGVTWDLIKLPEVSHVRDVASLWLVEFLQDPGAMNWNNAIKLADKMGFLGPGVVDSAEPSSAEQSDADLLELGDVPEAYKDQ